MAGFTPFQPAVKSGAAGLTQTIALGAGSATSQNIVIPASVGTGNNAVLVTCVLSVGLTAYVRIGVESSSVIAATTADTPFPGNNTTSVVHLFASPNPAGAYTIAVIVSTTPTTAGQIWFTPGEGGTGY